MQRIVIIRLNVLLTNAVTLAGTTVYNLFRFSNVIIGTAKVLRSPVCGCFLNNMLLCDNLFHIIYFR